MEKIEKNLAELIKINPCGVYKVIVVFESTIGVDTLNLKEYNLLMPGILSVALTGKEIVQLANNLAVNSIEVDAEMSIL